MLVVVRTVCLEVDRYRLFLRANLVAAFSSPLNYIFTVKKAGSIEPTSNKLNQNYPFKNPGWAKLGFGYL